MNKVILMGNLTRDPESRVFTGGGKVCSFSLAVNRTYKGTDGQRNEEVSFVDCSCFGQRGEVIQKYLSKGDPILIEGRLRQESWESKEGGKRTKLAVVVEAFHFTRGAAGGGGKAGGGAPVADDGGDVPF